MEIKGEANAIKLEVAKNLKQLSDKVVIGKNVENNKIEIKSEDRSKHLSMNVNFIFVGEVTPQQIEDITKRVKGILDEEANIVKSSGDKVFEPQVSLGISPTLISSETANALIVKNRDYVIEGKPKPKFITITSDAYIISPENPPKT